MIAIPFTRIPDLGNLERPGLGRAAEIEPRKERTQTHAHIL